MEIEPGLAVETLTPLTSEHRSVDMHRLKVWQGEELRTAPIKNLWTRVTSLTTKCSQLVFTRWVKISTQRMTVFVVVLLRLVFCLHQYSIQSN